MRNLIRSSKGHIRMTKLEAGYKEQRAWLSVGMEKHTVELVLQPWHDKPIAVSYTIAAVDGGHRAMHVKRFHRWDIEAARTLFKKAGRVGEWPHEKGDELR